MVLTSWVAPTGKVEGGVTVDWFRMGLMARESTNHTNARVAPRPKSGESVRQPAQAGLARPGRNFAPAAKNLARLRIWVGEVASVAVMASPVMFSRGRNSLARCG